MADVEAPSGLGIGSSLPEGELTSLRVEAEGAAARDRARRTASRLIGRDALIYGFGMILTRAASFIMLPVYTRVLTTADYGLLQMLDMTVDVVSILVSAGMMQGVMRFYFKASTDLERQSIISTAFVMLIGLNLVGTAVLAALAVPLWRHALDGAGAVWYVYVAAANFTLGALMVVPLLVMQIQGRAMRYTVTSLGKLILQLTLNIVFLVVLSKGPVGILISTLISNVVIGCASAIWLFRRTGFRVSRRAASDLRRFGVPYQVATAGNFILTFGDRFFLQPTFGLAAVGIYSFAYQFGFLMSSLGVGPYLQAWWPRRYEIVSQPPAHRDEQYNAGFFFLSLVAMTVAVGIAIFVHPTLRIMSKPSFLPAANLVPIILAAYVIQAWGITAQFGIDVSEQTRYSMYAVWVSAAAVIVLYAVLIPTFGGLGAAIATVISFAIRTLCLFLFAQRLWPIHYVWRPHFRLGALAVAVVIASYFTRTRSLLLETVSSCLLVLLYAALVWQFALTPDRRKDIRSFLENKRRSLSVKLARA